MPFHVIIPARLASTRLPEKPLKDIAGKSMIQRVFERANLSSALSVTVATDSPKIEAHVKAFGGHVVLTSESHASGTDRLQEAAAKLSLGPDELVVNVQGDEPLIPPEVIEQVAQILDERPGASASTLSEPIESIDALFNPNAVKVVRDISGKALYFSRSPIPWDRESFSGKEFGSRAPGGGGQSLPQDFSAQRHIGIYAYRVSLLNAFVNWPASALEQIEKLEQLRIMENGHTIYVQEAQVAVPGGVDTEADLMRICQSLEGA